MIKRCSRRSVAVALATFTIVLTACGGDDDDGAGATSTTGDVTTTAGDSGGGDDDVTVDLTCPLTAGQIGEVVDLEVVLTYESASECGFQPEGTPAFRAPAVHYHLFPKSLSLTAIRDELGYTEPVDGIGDDAFTGQTAVGPTGTGAGLLVRAGDVIFEIYVDLEKGDDAHLAAARELAALVVAQA